MNPSMPKAIGLYDPTYEHDACGVAFVARLDGVRSHETIRRAITALENLEHRGAQGADPKTGDGAGILIQMPDEFFRTVIDDLPPAGRYGVAVCFLPREDIARRAEFEALLERTVEEEGQRVLGWRDVPIDTAHAGDAANAARPEIRQLFVGAADDVGDDDAFERKLYVIRRVAERAAGPELVIPSFSARTIVYKGMLISFQLDRFYPDLHDERTKSALGLVHSRYSTNTFPSWELAHPYRMIAHNGEINTLRGNSNWMRARESQLASELFGDDIEKLVPVIRPAGSDSATFDNVLELLTLGGRSLPHAMMMMIPEAYAERDDLPEELEGFYAYHSCLMEPWDGPAAVAFTDGRVIGATLDRNGLRPGRWLETHDGWVVLASETGVLPIPIENVKRKGRLQPGNLFLVDLDRGRIVDDAEIKREIATRRPYGKWFGERTVHLDDLPDKEPLVPRTEPLRSRQLAFGYTQEDLRVLLAPMAANAEEPIGSMGNDARAPGHVRPPAAALLLLQAALRPGDQPADRPDPRGRGHEPRHGCRRRGQPARRDPRARAPARDGPADHPQPRAREAAPGRPPHLQRPHDRHHVGGLRGPGRDGHGRPADLRRGARRDRRGREHHHPVGPPPRRRARADPLAARGRLGAPPPRPRGHPPAGRPRARVRRAARGPPLRDADRLRRERHQPVPDVRVAQRAGREGHAPGGHGAGRREGARRQGDRQGPAQDDLQDGDLHDPVLLRRADLRGRRAWTAS